MPRNSPDFYQSIIGFEPDTETEVMLSILRRIGLLYRITKEPQGYRVEIGWLDLPTDFFSPRSRRGKLESVWHQSAADGIAYVIGMYNTNIIRNAESYRWRYLEKKKASETDLVFSFPSRAAKEAFIGWFLDSGGEEDLLKVYDSLSLKNLSVEFNHPINKIRIKKEQES